MWRCGRLRAHADQLALLPSIDCNGSFFFVHDSMPNEKVRTRSDPRPHSMSSSAPIPAPFVNVDLIPENQPSGIKIPALTFGTWKIPVDANADGDGAAICVKNAIQAGFRHIDTARVYQNEAAVGEGLALARKEGLCTDRVFVTTKLWPSDFANVAAACEASRKKLGVEKIDLYLLHWPVAVAHEVDAATGESALFPWTSDEKNALKLWREWPGLLATWHEMEKLVDAGVVRAIGLSNVSPAELRLVCEGAAKHKPAAVQVEQHAALPQLELLAECEKQGCILQAYCALGYGLTGFDKQQNIGSLMEVPDIRALADKAGVPVAELLLSFCAQTSKRTAVLTRSQKPSRIASNAALRVPLLSDDVMRALLEWSKATYPHGHRTVNPPFFRPEPGKRFFPA